MKSLLIISVFARVICLVVIFVFASVVGLAQDPGGIGGDPDATVPFDGGLTILIAAGVGYGVKKIRDEQKRSKGKR